jgi:hypothetical protein
LIWSTKQYYDPAQIELLGAMARQWGFLREPSKNELELGDWFAMSRGSEIAEVHWFERIEGMPDVAGLHYAVSPRCRKVWPVRLWLDSVIGFARDSGFQKLVAGVNGLPLDYLLRYVEIWNRRHLFDPLTIESSIPAGSDQVVVVSLETPNGT